MRILPMAWCCACVLSLAGTALAADTTVVVESPPASLRDPVTLPPEVANDSMMSGFEYATRRGDYRRVVAWRRHPLPEDKGWTPWRLVRDSIEACEPAVECPEAAPGQPARPAAGNPREP